MTEEELISRLALMGFIFPDALQATFRFRAVLPKSGSANRVTVTRDSDLLGQYTVWSVVRPPKSLRTADAAWEEVEQILAYIAKHEDRQTCTNQ